MTVAAGIARIERLRARLAAAGCNRGILDPVGPVGSAEKQILINSTAIMLAIIIPTMIATVAFAWWFRRGNTKATYRPDWEYSGAIELVVWAIPALTIMLLGGIAWIGSHELEPSKPLKSAKPAAQGRGRLARLEMAVHLPRPGHRDGQPAGRSGRHAGQFPADLGDRLERLLRPADGDDDLHHAADDDAPEPAGGPAGRL